MAWFDDNNPNRIDSLHTESSLEEIFEAVSLDADNIKAFATKFGLETTKDEDNEYIAIPTDHFKDANFSSQFLDYWIGNTSEKLSLEQKRRVRNASYLLMDEILGEATLSLDMYADEAVGMGFIEQPIDIEIEGTSDDVKNGVMEILKRNEFIKRSRSHLRNLAKWGDLGVLLELPEKNDPLDIKLKIYTPDYWTAFSPNNCKVSVGFQLETSTAKKSNSYTSRVSIQDVLQPWEFVQFSVYDSELAPYGRGLLEGLRTPFDQLVTIEALLAMSRATRVERLIIKIPTGQSNPTAALAKLNEVQSRWKNTIFSDKSMGRKSYAKNPAMQDVMFVPADEGFDVQRLNAGSGVEISNTDDVEYFRDKLLMVTGIPKGILLADESTDRYHALAQQDLKFARRLIPFQDAYAAGLTKLVMLLVGYVGGDIDTTKVKVKIKRPVQISDQVLANYEAISRSAAEMIDNFKRSNESNEGARPKVDIELYSKLMSQLGMPEEIVNLFDKSKKNDPDDANTPDDDNITTSVSDSTRANLKTFVFNDTAVECSSDEIKASNIALFEIFRTPYSSSGVLLEALEGKAKNIITKKNLPSTTLKEFKNVRTSSSK